MWWSLKAGCKEAIKKQQWREREGEWDRLKRVTKTEDLLSTGFILNGTIQQPCPLSTHCCSALRQESVGGVEVLWAIFIHNIPNTCIANATLIENDTHTYSIHKLKVNTGYKCLYFSNSINKLPNNKAVLHHIPPIMFAFAF